jgi:hypothetical protein
MTGSYGCPDKFVKCPGSYCIPSRLICDGELHCPGGEDESDCGKDKMYFGP